MSITSIIRHPITVSIFATVFGVGFLSGAWQAFRNGEPSDGSILAGLSAAFLVLAWRAWRRLPGRWSGR